MTACTSPPATSSSPSIKSARWATRPYSKVQTPHISSHRSITPSAAHGTNCLPIHRLQHSHQSVCASAPVSIGLG